MRLGKANLKNFVFRLTVALAFNYICFANIGCGSAKQNKKLRFLFCFALAFHYICRWDGKRRSNGGFAKGGKTQCKRP